MLIGDDIYFVLGSPSVTILKVSLGQNHLTIIDTPELPPHEYFECTKVVLMKMEDGSLGFAAFGVKDLICGQ